MWQTQYLESLDIAPSPQLGPLVSSTVSGASGMAASPRGASTAITIATTTVVSSAMLVRIPTFSIQRQLTVIVDPTWYMEESGQPTIGQTESE
jgi:hypothetical protein